MKLHSVLLALVSFVLTKKARSDIGYRFPTTTKDTVVLYAMSNTPYIVKRDTPHLLNFRYVELAQSGYSVSTHDKFNMWREQASHS